MKLLIITQKVDRNDPVLGFFHRWLEEFAKNVESLSVICLQEGEYSLPENVHVFSLGKEHGSSRLKYIFRFYRLLRRLRGSYDSVFVHMNQVYVLLGGPFWRARGIPVGFWYAHRANTFSLRLAEKIANVIFTNTLNSFTVPSCKVIALGHGIDVEATKRPDSYSENRRPTELLCAGRITPIKDQETILLACGLLERKSIPFKIGFVGGAATQSDETYLKILKKIISDQKIEQQVNFYGNVPQRNLFPYYWKAAVHINACPTGGMDKVVLEAAAGGAIPVVTNESFRDFLGVYADRLIFKTADPKNLAEILEALLNSNDQEEIRSYLKKKVLQNFDLGILTSKIIHWYETGR